MSGLSERKCYLKTTGLKGVLLLNVVGSFFSSAEARIGDEIVVTAQRREEFLQKSAVTITALTEDEIAERGLAGLSDFAFGAPGVSLSDRGPGRTQIVIRGVVADRIANDEPQNRATVGLYFDEAPVAVNGFNPDLRLVDVKQIEILRGPQGTLFGAGAMAGAIRIITNKPDPNSYDAFMETTISTTEHGGFNYAGNGMLNIPVAEDKLGVRLVGYYESDSGYIDNITTGEEDVNSSEIWGGRLSVLWNVGVNTSFQANIIHQELSTDSRPTEFLEFGEGDFKQDIEVPEIYDNNFMLYNGVLTHDFGWGEFVSSTSYIDQQSDQIVDPSFVIPLFFGVDLPAPIVNRSEVEDFFQEVRIAADDIFGFKAVFGAFYNNQSKSFVQEQYVPGFGAASGIPTELFGREDVTFEGDTSVDLEQFAVFAESSYDLTNALTATAGVRWFDISVDASISAAGFLNDGPTMFEGKQSENGFNPRFTLDYEVNDALLLYGTVARGFRSGGVNDFVPDALCAADLAAIGRDSSPRTFASDSLWNYEGGLKSTLLDGRMIFNAAAFYIEWDGVQTSRSLGCGFNFRENAGKVRSVGAEWDISASPVEDVVFLGLRGSYVNSELAENSENLGAVKGDRAPYAPRWNVSTFARVEQPVAGGLNAFAQAEFLYVGESFSSFDMASAIRQPDWTKTNFRLGVTSENWSADIFVNNVFDKRIPLLTDSFFGREIVERGRPRTIGVRLRASM